MTRLLWLADVLRNAGLKVVETPGWKNRGVDMEEIKGILCHHTAGPKKGNMPSLGTLIDGRSDLKGPLSQLGLGRDGTYYIVAAGKCNHAGAGIWKGVEGNRHFIGIEAENTGYVRGPTAEPWSEVIMNAYAEGVAALVEKLNIPVGMVAGHKEYAPKRKTDPTFDMNAFRKRIESVMARKKKEEKLVIATVADAPVFVVPVKDVIPPVKTVELKKYNPNELRGDSRPAYAKKLLQDCGWKDFQAAAIIGNAMAESGKDLDTDIEGDYLLNKRIVPRGTPGAKPSAYGSFQWRGGRLVNLDNFAKKNGKNKNDLRIQILFTDWELRNTEKRVGIQLRESTDMMEALRAAIGFLRPGGWSHESPENGNGWKARLVNAYSLMENK